MSTASVSLSNLLLNFTKLSTDQTNSALLHLCINLMYEIRDEKIPISHVGDAIASEKESFNNATESQSLIITYPPDHNCILSVKAGPGSGKTRTLTSRIAYLIRQHGIAPNEILVLSMANRSVLSLRDSLVEILEEDITKEINLSTFHLFCARLVDQNASHYLPHLGKRKLVDDQSWRYFSTIFLGKYVKLDGHNIDGTLSASKFEELISLVRSGQLTSQEAAVKFNVNQKYVESLMKYLDSTGMIRYNDLINNAMKIIELSRDGEYIKELHHYKVVVVDEFQDMYHNLLSIIEMVVKYPTINHPLGTSKHLTIAGDPNQSIYEFLGSKPQIMDEIERHFCNDVKEIKVEHKIIEESFRCTPEVLECALTTCLGPHNEMSNRIKSVKSSGHLPVIKYFKSPSEEYNFIIEEIVRLCCELGGLVRLSDFVILARTNKEVEEINRILTENYGINYNKLSSSLSWLKSKVQILLNILTVIERSNGCELSLMCLLMYLDREMGNKTRISKMFTLSRSWGIESGIRGSDCLEDYLISNSLNDVPKKFSIKSIYKTPRHLKSLSKVNNFLNLVVDERTILGQEYDTQTPDMILQSLLNIVEGLGLKDYMNEPTSLRRFMDVNMTDHEVFKYRKGLLNELKAFNASLNACYQSYLQQDVLSVTGDSFLRYFIKNYAEDFQVLSDDLINTSTIHAAKGLEFPFVFVVGTSVYGSGSWSTILNGSSEIPSSESRLLYVAMTRSRNLLYLGTSSQIADISDRLIDSFTTQLPNLNDSFLNRLSRDLKRSLPTPTKVYEGKQLYKQFGLLASTRGYHTSSLSCHMSVSNKNLIMGIRGISRLIR